MNQYDKNQIYYTTGVDLKPYGILYARPAFPKGHRLEWLNSCAMTGILPKDIQTEIKSLSTHINEKYKDVIVVPMDNRIVPGCISTPESIDEIAKEIYDGMNNIFKRLIGGDNLTRLVYSVGDMHENWILKSKTTHEIGNYPVMVKVGRTLDSSNDPGFFKV